MKPRFNSNYFSKLILVILMSFSASIFASELTAPKKSGIIGERFDGYLGIVKDGTPEVKALVQEVNQKRKARYQEIAVKRQQPLNKIELVAGEAAINKTLSGNYILVQGGSWQKK